MSTATTTAEPGRPGLGYDPEAVLLSVRPWVYELAKRYCRRKHWPSLADDLACSVLATLWEQLAAGHYDPARGRPSTYAAMVFGYHAGRHFARLSSVVYVPDHAADPRRTASPEMRRKARAALAALGPFEIAAATPDPGPEPPEAIGEAEESARRLRLATAALGQIDPQWAGVLRRRLGLDGEPETCVAIGASMGISKNRANQIEMQAIDRIRRLIDARRDRDDA